MGEEEGWNSPAAAAAAVLHHDDAIRCLLSPSLHPWTDAWRNHHQFNSAASSEQSPMPFHTVLLVVEGVGRPSGR
jgi:hypothetical protein